MPSDADDSGLFTFMIGLILVVFAGVGLSIAVDRRFSFSSYVSSLKRDIKDGQVELGRLSEIRREFSQRLEGIEPERRMAVSARNTLSRQVADLQQRRPTLTAARDELGNSIIALEEEFSRYRGKYREAIWHAAVGQSLGTLRIRGGREYQDAVITRVTDVGLEIRHVHGTARVQAPDLDSSLQERFQWDDKERRVRLGEERADHKALESVPEISKRRKKPRRDRMEVRPDFSQIHILRGKVGAWRSKVSQLHSDRNRALSSAYGSQTSPPGGLETWQGRVARLGGELAKAEGELAAAKAHLAVVSPDDELLKSQTGGR
jgi:hypothetical protein